MRTSLTTVFSLLLATVSIVADAASSNNNDELVALPLIPHHALQTRRRRELRLNPSTPIPPSARRRASHHLQQIGALYQGYGTHYVDLWVGTPPQRQTVIVDTGSGVTAFPCSSCDDCGMSYHTDNYFIESDSITFEKLTCKECYKGSCSKDTFGLSFCRISMSYQEGSSWTAYEGRDVTYAGGFHDKALIDRYSAAIGNNTDDDAIRTGNLPEQATAFSFPLVFGCQTRLTGLFKTQLADGIMGMDNAQGSFWKQMQDAKAITQPNFSLCFNRQPLATRQGTGAGALTMGGVDKRFHSTPMVYAKNFQGGGFYTVQLRKLYLRRGGGESVADNDGMVALNIDEHSLNYGGVIVDSGTTDTYMSSKLARPFRAAWKEMVGSDFSNEPVSISDEKLHQLPTIIFQLEAADPIDIDEVEEYTSDVDLDSVVGLAGHDLEPDNPRDILVAMPASHYMEFDAEMGKYIPRFYVDERSGSVLGANLMMGHDVTFDIVHQRIGFAESSCDYLGLITGKPTPELSSNNPFSDKSDETGNEIVSGKCDTVGCKTGVFVGILGAVFAVGMVTRYFILSKRNTRYHATETELAGVDEDDGEGTFT